MQIIENAVYMGAAKPGEGGAPVIDELNVTPSTSAQVITAPEGTDGYSPVNVAAVTSSIDANITAGNIKDGVEILGVTGNYTGSAIIRYGANTDAFLGTLDANGILQKPTTPTDLVFTGVKGFSSYSASAGVLFRRFQNLESIRSVNFPDLETISTDYAMGNCFYGCTGITSVSFPALTALNANWGLYYCFYGCTSITSVSFPALTTVTAGAFSSKTGAFQSGFEGCTNITNVDMSLLTVVQGYNPFTNCFSGCTGITSISFQSLTQVYGSVAFSNCFKGCTSLSTMFFPSVTNLSTDAFNNMLSSVSGCTIHFPNNMQSKISVLMGYPNFGGSSTTVLFDLPATVTLTGANSTAYSRNPKYDTATALGWKVGAYGTTNFTPYYTSGTTDPAVGDTIYSDSACTQAVTTISSIA